MDKENRMKIAMKEFDSCLYNWVDLPDYVYTQEYEYAFRNFVTRRLELRSDLSETEIKLFVNQILDHETDENKLPYFEFVRRNWKAEQDALDKW